MKLFLTIISSMSILLSFGQFNFDANWHKIDELEKKGLYREALESVDLIIEEAIKANESIQVIKANFFQLKYNRNITEDDYILGINRIESLIEKSDQTTASILHSILAEVYFGYYSQNSWKFSDRTVSSPGIKNNDIRTWDLEKLAGKVIANYQMSIQHSDALSIKKVSEFSDLIIGIDDDLNSGQTLFDFLSNRAFTFFSENSFNIQGPAETFSLNSDIYFKSNSSFIEHPIQTKDSFNLNYFAVEVLQASTKILLKSNNSEVLFRNHIKRLKWVRRKSTLQNKEELFEEALKNLTIAYKDHKFVGEAWFELSQLYVEQSHNLDLRTASKENIIKRKQAAVICKQVITLVPNSFGAQQCEALLSQIEQKSLSLKVEDVYLPNSKNRIQIGYTNCTKAFIKIIEFDPKENSNAKALKAFALEQKEVYKSEVNLTGTNDYLQHATEALLPELEPGYYLVIVSSESNFSDDSVGTAFAKFWVTQLTYQTKRNNEDFEVMAICRKTGHPLEGAEVKIKRSEYNRVIRKYVSKTIGTYKTDKLGKVVVKGLDNYKSYYVSLKSGDDSYDPNRSFYYSKYGNVQRANTKVSLFTDRTLYRPGQTIYFKGVVTKFDGKTNKLETNYKTEIKFYDANYQIIQSIPVISNEFGSFEGKFLAPLGVLTGQMTLKCSNGSTQVQVEEYKRPKFSALIESLEGEYQLNDNVTVKGIAEAFAGNKISDAVVKYRIQRTARFDYWYWWYRSSPAKQVFNGETITNEKGEFEFIFKAVPDESVDPKTRPIFNYTISVDVVDINGETHSTSKILKIGYHSLLLSNTIDNELNSDQATSFTIEANSLNGSLLDASGTYEISKLIAPKGALRNRLWPAPDKPQWTQVEFKKFFPADVYQDELDYTSWPLGDKVQNGSFDTKKSGTIRFLNVDNWTSGLYKYVAITKDKYGVEVLDETYFTVYHQKSKKPIDNNVFKIIAFSNTIKPGQKASFLLTTAEDHLNIYYNVDFKGKTIKEEWIHLKNEQRQIDFPVMDEHIGTLSFNFIVVKNDRSYHKNYSITVPEPDHHLKISLESFRDKLLPGQDETWTLVVKNAKNEKAQAELLAALYDASLDDLFRKNNFNLSLFKPYYRIDNWTSPVGFSQVSGSNISYYWNTQVNMPFRQLPYINTYGYSAGYYGRYRSNNISSGLFMDSAEMDDSVPLHELEGVKASGKKEATKPVSAPEISTVGNKNVDGDTKLVTGVENTQLSSIQPRKNFNETAFFYPQLHTSDNGEIRIKFTMPESLTKWRFIGLAHSKTLEIGNIEKELITQKDLMVIPNMPRFFRENDHITVSTKIANVSKMLINGTASIKLIDPITENDITSQFIQMDVDQPFSVETDGSTKVSWNLNISDKVTAVKYQIIAKSLKHSDGEENVLPILSNRMLVTESMPMPMSGKGSKSFTFTKLKNNKSTSLKHHQLTLEYTSNPAWYALQAMPYMMEYPYECAEQTFTRYYANAIATHVLNSKPKIKAIINQWQAESPEAFLSNLNKNQELKTLILEETPWVLNAKSESETKQNLAILLDLNRMNGELAKALSKTIKSQSSSGGWAWFPGMRDNRYITQHIMTGLGHLDVLGIAAIKKDRSVRNMVEKGIRFLDREILKDFEKLKKYHSETYLKNNYIGYTQIQYLYMRSYFSDIKMNKGTEAALLYYKNQAEKYWLTFNIYAKGMIGLAAKRNDMNPLANDIYKSLKDNSIIHEEFGMYWKSYKTGFSWYQAPIENQALMIEFFNEMGDHQSVEKLKMWLLKEKQTTHWKTTKQTAEAVYALLLNGIDLLDTEQLATIKIGGKAIEYVKEESTNPYKVKPEAGTGYFKTKWNETEISTEMGNVEVSKMNSGPSWGAMYWQYFEQIDKITFAKTPLILDKSVHKVILTDRGEKLQPITENNNINIGDKIRIRIELRTDRSLEYVHMKDMRAAGFEPISTISSFKYQDGLGYYQATKDAATNFFFDYIPKGTYVFEYDLRAEQLGDFSNGIATIQCMYAPEFTSHSNGIRLSIKER